MTLWSVTTRDLCDVEFTVEDGHLWILQTRVGKRSPAAAFRIAVDLVDAGYIDMDEALVRVDGDQLQSLLHPLVHAGRPVRRRRDRSGREPGCRRGRAACSSPGAAVIAAAQGRQVVLARPRPVPTTWRACSSRGCGDDLRRCG